MTYRDGFRSSGFEWVCPPRKRYRKMRQRDHVTAGIITLAIMIMAGRWGWRIGTNGVLHPNLRPH